MMRSGSSIASPADWLHAGFFFPYKHHKIFFRQHLSKNACILLLHGFPTSSWDWCKVWDALANHYRLLAPDFMGLGFSDKPLNYPYSIFDQADMIEHLISEVGSAQFHILAHDYGASVAQELAARFNENKRTGKPYFNIETICFLNGGLFPAACRPLLLQKILCSRFGNIASRLMNQYTFEKSFRKIFGPHTKATSQEITYFWHIINYNSGKKAIPKVIRYLREREKFSQRWTAALQQTDIPLRLINGSEDPVSGIRMAGKYQELIRQADVVLLQGIGHYPQIEAPANMVEAYLKFLMLHPSCV